MVDYLGEKLEDPNPSNLEIGGYNSDLSNPNFRVGRISGSEFDYAVTIHSMPTLNNMCPLIFQKKYLKTGKKFRTASFKSNSKSCK